ncbi:helix-turn-helix transcriptional regulator [Actinomycetospora termitidis]|uniref:Helix-turn-helix transcriptional regulator n=1 Tax=Actinomycetospora termitidis TaxID=3053470 RepID=A0ABT7MEZ3_9PSEU|nr:helix-turn-helix transcriptional regulator [Actinomycetospora sp. Odt1-22]MDL5159229.1 helix-turn-helix transcriptional regulator [Actinomycetospora sp. Odt1-22]
MDAVGTLLGTVRVEDPVLRVERLGPGPASLSTGHRWVLITLAAGQLSVAGAVLGPGDALLTRGRGLLAGTVGDDGTTALVAEFTLHGERLVRLPEAVVCPADSEMCRLLIERLAEQLDAAPAQDVVSARLLDWIVTETVRDALVAQESDGAVSDPVVAAALAAVHGEPAGAWTVDRLARSTGVSRALFARRFRDVVGTSPLSYVRSYRLDLAERALLTEPDATVAAIARRVGYANPFSFSTAFRRHRGLAPSEVRERA